ncbi:MAG: hypothetical protein LIO54_09210 [Oscillospiraceae bacterium]|nr:hypothetical protein [Oscillospiraceae bacterium]
MKRAEFDPLLFQLAHPAILPRRRSRTKPRSGGKNGIMETAAPGRDGGKMRFAGIGKNVENRGNRWEQRKNLMFKSVLKMSITSWIWWLQDFYFCRVCLSAAVKPTLSRDRY